MNSKKRNVAAVFLVILLLLATVFILGKRRSSHAASAVETGNAPYSAVVFKRNLVWGLDYSRETKDFSSYPPYSIVDFGNDLEAWESYLADQPDQDMVIIVKDESGGVMLRGRFCQWSDGRVDWETFGDEVEMEETLGFDAELKRLHSPPNTSELGMARTVNYTKQRPLHWIDKLGRKLGGTHGNFGASASGGMILLMNEDMLAISFHADQPEAVFRSSPFGLVRILPGPKATASLMPDYASFEAAIDPLYDSNNFSNQLFGTHSLHTILKP